MQSLRRMVLVVLTCVLMVSGTVAAHAESSAEAVHNAQQELDAKANEKNSLNQEIEKIENEMATLNNYIQENKKSMADTQNRIAEMQALIEQKKEEIVVLQDKIHNRKDLMKKRLVALQTDDNVNVVINVVLESENFTDLIQRATAITTLFNADKDIINEQENDVRQIEEDKKEIDKQETLLAGEYENLAKQQAELDANLQKQQETLTVMQEKYSQVNSEMAGIQAKLNEAQAKIAQEQAASRATSAASPKPAAASSPAPTGVEMYVSSTAYSHESSGSITAMGYNIEANPNMKLIAVDPSVIPLGSKVWVEGYGVAIAGDTGGAIKGHKIDVLMPNNAAAYAWGRRTVKIVVLN
nr:3D domain-containing protein [Neobacillus sp. Marseille-Q6967]